MKNELIFGNSNSFGIRYIPSTNYHDSNNNLATLHLLLGGQIIGDPNEVCSKGTWLRSIEQILKRLTSDFDKLYNKEFEHKSDKEIFELIYKSNQLEEEFDEEFSYLPVLPNEVWKNCNVSLDETIDAYLLVMIPTNNQIKFIWKGWRDPCPDEQIDKLNSIEVNKEFVTKTIEECISIVSKNFVHYE